jgi:hypothetical protein
VESQTNWSNTMTEQEEFEFRLRLESEGGATTTNQPTPEEEIPAPLRLIGDEPKPPTMSEYLLNRAQMGLTNIPALLGGASAIYGTYDGEFPSQLPPQGTTQQAMDAVRSGLGINPNLQPATSMQRYIGAGVEAAADPLNLFGLGGAKSVLGLAGKTLFSTGTAGVAGVAGEVGGEAGRQVGGLTGQVIGGISSALLFGGVTSKAGQVLFDKAKARFNPKDFDIQDLADVEGASRAKDLVERALEADPNLQQRLKSIQDRVLFVTGEKGTAAVTGLDNLALRTKLEDIARNDVGFATEVQQLYANLKDAVRKKSNELYPAPSAEIPSGKAKIAEQEVDYDKRIGFINNQLDKITSNFDITGVAKPTEIGTSIQNLVLSKEKAARAALRPEYDSVLGQASNQGALLSAQDTQNLLRTAEDLFQGDPWAKQAPLLKLVREQSSKFNAMRRQAAPIEPGTTLPATTAPDLTMGMDITSLDSLKRRVAQDIRETRDLNRQDKLRLLQTNVDEALNKVQNSSGDIQVDLRGEKMPFGQAIANLDNDYFNKVGIPFRNAEAIKKISSLDYSEKIAPLIATSPTAMTQFLRVAGEEGTGLAEKAVMSKMYNQSLDKNGYVDPAKLQSLLSKTSNNGGYSDIVDQLPALKQKLNDATIKSQYLSSEKVAIDDAAKETRTRLGQSFLSDYDAGGVDSIVSKMVGSTGKGYRNKFFVDLKKLSSDEQTNVKLAVKNGLVGKMLSAENPMKYLDANKDTFAQVFGEKHVNNLMSLADVARLANKVDIDKLNIRAAAVKESSIIERAMGGVSPQQITGIAVNQISSVFNKAFRIMALIGKNNIDEATREAHRKLFLDENGMDKILNTSTRLLSKKGEEVDLKSFVKPEDLSDFGKALGMGALRSGYFGGSAAISPSQVIQPKSESFYQNEE